MVKARIIKKTGYTEVGRYWLVCQQKSTEQQLFMCNWPLLSNFFPFSHVRTITTTPHTTLSLPFLHPGLLPNNQPAPNYFTSCPSQFGFTYIPIWYF